MEPKAWNKVQIGSKDKHEHIMSLFDKISLERTNEADASRNKFKGMYSPMGIHRKSMKPELSPVNMPPNVEVVR